MPTKVSAALSLGYDAKALLDGGASPADASAKFKIGELAVHSRVLLTTMSAKTKEMMSDGTLEIVGVSCLSLLARMQDCSIKAVEEVFRQHGKTVKASETLFEESKKLPREERSHYVQDMLIAHLLHKHKPGMDLYVWLSDEVARLSALEDDEAPEPIAEELEVVQEEAGEPPSDHSPAPPAVDQEESAQEEVIPPETTTPPQDVAEEQPPENIETEVAPAEEKAVTVPEPQPTADEERAIARTTANSGYRLPERTRMNREELRRWSPRPISKSPKIELTDAQKERLHEIKQRFKAQINANVWHIRSGRYVLATINTPEEYLLIFDEGRFKFQRAGATMPENYPDPEEVRQLIRA